jgi:hypothetical protein
MMSDLVSEQNGLATFFSGCVWGGGTRVWTWGLHLPGRCCITWTMPPALSAMYFPVEFHAGWTGPRSSYLHFPLAGCQVSPTTPHFLLRWGGLMNFLFGGGVQPQSSHSLVSQVARIIGVSHHAWLKTNFLSVLRPLHNLWFRNY